MKYSLWSFHEIFLNCTNKPDLSKKIVQVIIFHLLDTIDLTYCNTSEWMFTCMLLFTMKCSRVLERFLVLDWLEFTVHGLERYFQHQTCQTFQTCQRARTWLRDKTIVSIGFQFLVMEPKYYRLSWLPPPPPPLPEKHLMSILPILCNCKNSKDNTNLVSKTLFVNSVMTDMNEQKWKRCGNWCEVISHKLGCSFRKPRVWSYRLWTGRAHKLKIYFFISKFARIHW